MGRTAEITALATASFLIFLVSSIIPLFGWIFALLIIDAMWVHYNETTDFKDNDTRE